MRFGLDEYLLRLSPLPLGPHPRFAFDVDERLHHLPIFLLALVLLLQLLETLGNFLRFPKHLCNAVLLLLDLLGALALAVDFEHLLDVLVVNPLPFGVLQLAETDDVATAAVGVH